ncbi:MAG: DUF2783 domain-containing protein [Proteobacteria bacterium]|uniref:DUF2783 domain-containing protein n=1 Tax=Reyranella massiliensis TaxID=445220 RepID=UPI0006ACF240|nr:DUF2783 domain-containing protein [Reyranella massiliensis]MCA0248641.1 DUF2783 domain-containing protein [Pseudomonadota bacterium]
MSDDAPSAVVTGALRRSLNLSRPDDVYNAIVDAHKDLSDEQCRAFDARLILLLANHVGDEAAIREALAAARQSLEEEGA